MRSPLQIHENDNPPILILGGGFGGLFTALHLRDLHSCPIILIDQSWNFVFKPLLYELLSSEVKLELICPRYDQLLHNSANLVHPFRWEPKGHSDCDFAAWF